MWGPNSGGIPTSPHYNLTQSRVIKKQMETNPLPYFKIKREGFLCSTRHFEEFTIILGETEEELKTEYNKLLNLLQSINEERYFFKEDF